MANWLILAVAIAMAPIFIGGFYQPLPSTSGSPNAQGLLDVPLRKITDTIVSKRHEAIGKRALKGQKGEGGPYAANKTMPLLCLMEHWAA